ncbi:hypothetical protein BD410DRAFT_815795 [Rickenella mellea]|uniref:Uncharacterized protein n=1 Tax=Rickenella mellea TaxID=50990 RepID=A0A4Y7PX26_9AGAM|nr:hypothetical protein BD410DRAFT_815795 [Rickenella mellea]
MACLNLPVDIRYLPENMYLVGIVPGPSKPHLNDLNHYLRPLMDDMSQAWSDGIYLSQTHNHPNGRHTRSAIIIVVNDLPSARDTAALAPHNSHIYCSICECKQLQTRGNTNYHDWRVRDHKEMRRHAEAWRDATTHKKQDDIFKAHGIRWSELWRLPYWNPTQQLVVDPMHCILEGLGQHQSRHVLGLSAALANEQEEIVPAFTHEFRHPNQVDWDSPKLNENEVKHVIEIHKLLTAPRSDDTTEEQQDALLYDRLMKKNKGPLEFVCKDVGTTVSPDRTRPTSEPTKFKSDYATALMQWRRGKPSAASNHHPRITTPRIMQHIKNVIKETVTPSWLGSVPHNFGDKAAGSLKADEWRTMYTVYLPLALVSLWGEGTFHMSAAASQRLREVLDHTMSLVSAITIACFRTMTIGRAIAYRSHVVKWLQDLQRLHPHIAQRTNNHMAVHVFDFFLLFGPTRSWWCFPFERLIGQLQRLPHNHRFGQLEHTVLRAFLKASKLRQWLARSDCPAAIKECKALFDKSYTSKPDDYSGGGEHRDSVFLNPSDLRGQDRREVPVPKDLRPLTKLSKVVMHARWTQNGVVYARASTHLGNSLVYFYPHDDISHVPVPGSIKYILNHANQVVFAIQRQLDVTPGVVDPFAPYPDFPAKLYSSAVRKELELVKPSLILCHYARWAISKEHVVILSLSKVRPRI